MLSTPEKLLFAIRLLATGAGTVATACPFCKTMLRDALKDKECVKGRAFGSPLARGLKPRASTAEVYPRASPGPGTPSISGFATSPNC